MVRTDVRFELWLTGRGQGDDVLPGGLSVSRDLAVGRRSSTRPKPTPALIGEHLSFTWEQS